MESNWLNVNQGQTPNELATWLGRDLGVASLHTGLSWTEPVCMTLFREANFFKAIINLPDSEINTNRFSLVHLVKIYYIPFALFSLWLKHRKISLIKMFGGDNRSYLWKIPNCWILTKTKPWFQYLYQTYYKLRPKWTLISKIKLVTENCYP